MYKEVSVGDGSGGWEVQMHGDNICWDLFR